MTRLLRIYLHHFYVLFPLTVVSSILLFCGVYIVAVCLHIFYTLWTIPRR